ncbi:MAG: CDP-alcohol phosphatidyltransferase family protein [Desulfobacterales bacterium]
MSAKLNFQRKFSALLVYGRPPLVFGGMLCAFAVMWTRSPLIYTLGVMLLIISMSFDLIDGWLATRFQLHSTLAHLADRVMDKIVYSTIFPLVAVGAMWRLLFTSVAGSKAELLHAIFVLILCVTVLIRDNFANFMRYFAMRTGPEPEVKEFTRLRTIVAAPVGTLLYAHAFFVTGGPDFKLYNWISHLGNLPLRVLFLIEIIFLIINFGSIAAYCRKYGSYCLDEICDEDERLRRHILSFFPNTLTIMNAMMGLLAVMFAYQGRIREAYLFLIGAAIFDKLDGALARKLGLTAPFAEKERSRRISFGGILDDVADAVSFCIVPAWIFYLSLKGVSDPLILQLPVGLVAWLYILLGISRLVYFTFDRTPIPGFFKGMPTPAAALLVTAPLIMFNQTIGEASEWIRYWGVFCFGLMVFAAIMMNLYRVRYLHLGRFMDKHFWFGRLNVMLLIISIFTPYLGYVALFYMIFYVLSPLITGRLLPKQTETDELYGIDASK